MDQPAEGRLGKSAFPDVCDDATRVNCGALHMGALTYDMVSVGLLHGQPKKELRLYCGSSLWRLGNMQ